MLSITHRTTCNKHWWHSHWQQCDDTTSTFRRNKYTNWAQEDCPNRQLSQWQYSKVT